MNNGQRHINVPPASPSLTLYPVERAKEGRYHVELSGQLRAKTPYGPVTIEQDNLEGLYMPDKEKEGEGLLYFRVKEKGYKITIGGLKELNRGLILAIKQRPGKQSSTGVLKIVGGVVVAAVAALSAYNLSGPEENPKTDVPKPADVKPKGNDASEQAKSDGARLSEQREKDERVKDVLYGKTFRHLMEEHGYDKFRAEADRDCLLLDDPLVRVNEFQDKLHKEIRKVDKALAEKIDERLRVGKDK